ncbi:MAG: hypothetical protein LBP60_05815 [Spirochaetaceae bacterium]|nr:hypothetical protein [Spirochaetaceae bacterium]
MKKKTFFVWGMAVTIIAAGLLVTACFSMPDLSAMQAQILAAQQAQFDAMNKITDFSTVPAPSSEASPLEGVWGYETVNGRITTKVEYAFTGNQFVVASDSIRGKNHSVNATRGIFQLNGSTMELYQLEQLGGYAAGPMDMRYFLPLSVTATADLYETLPSYQGTPAHITTVNYTLQNGQLVLSAPGQDTVTYTRQTSAAIQYPRATAQEKAAEMGVRLSDNESLIVIRRITETGLSTRIGEPEEWHIYLDGTNVKTIKKRETLAFPVSKGTHTIFIEFLARGSERRSREITFTTVGSTWVPFVTTMNGKVGRTDYNVRGDKVYLQIGTLD